MLNPYSRTELVIGREAVEKLHHSRVAVFGLGGVGGSAVEALARSGVGTLDLIDNDQVCMTNLNRQQFATVHTVGKQKTDAAEERIHDIDPAIIVHKYPVFYLPEKKDLFPFSEWDYIIDCIDTVTAKLDIIEEAKLFPAWAAETDWIPPCSGSWISMRRAAIRSAGSCGMNAGNGELSRWM